MNSFKRERERNSQNKSMFSKNIDTPYAPKKRYVCSKVLKVD